MKKIEHTLRDTANAPSDSVLVGGDLLIEAAEEIERLKEQLNLFAYELWEKERQLVAMKKRMMLLAETLMGPNVFVNHNYVGFVDDLVRPYLNDIKVIGGVKNVEQQILPTGHLHTSGTENLKKQP